MKVVNENKRGANMLPSIFTTLIGLAVLGGIVGTCYLTEATRGDSFLVGGCILATLARITQAHHQHLEVMDKLDSPLTLYHGTYPIQHFHEKQTLLQ